MQDNVYIIPEQYQPQLPPKTNAGLVLSIVGLCLGVTLFFCCGLLGAIPGLVCSIIGTAIHKKDVNSKAAKIIGIIGIVINALIIVGSVLIAIIIFGSSFNSIMPSFPYEELPL